MKKYIVVIMLAVVVSLPMAHRAFGRTVTAAKNWYLSETLESKTGALAGVKYQKIVDEEFGAVCYTAKFGNAISISCVK